MFTNNLPRYYFGQNSAHHKDILSNQGNINNYFTQMDKEQEIGSPESETNIDQSKNPNITLGITSVVEELYLSEPNLSRIPSPASSVASNKKLEWDSGADIGYNVQNSLKNSRKCKSFPILHVDLSPISHIILLNDSQTCTTTVTAKMTDNSQEHAPQLENKSLKLHKKKESFSHSTPIEHKINTKLTMSLRHEDNSLTRTKSKHKDRIVKKSSNIDECLQTTLIHISSKSVQTDDECLINKKEDKSKVNRSQQTDAISLSSERPSTDGSSSQTSSFQYIPGSNVVSRSSLENISSSSKSNKSTNITSTVSKALQSNITASESKLKLPISSRTETNNSHSSNGHSQSSDGSNSSPLGKMISTQQSKNLIADIDKSLYLLQRFLKSKNYNMDTKKYYAKKIVNKIIQNKYTSDSSSSSNKTDECSCCCTSNSSTEKSKIDSTHTSNKNEKSANEVDIVPETTNGKQIQSKESNEYIERKQQNDVKQADFVDCAIQCDPEQSYFINQNYSSDKKSLDQGTTVSTEVGITLSFKDDKKRRVRSVSRENLTDIYCDTSSKNWKENKTLSEKLFEAKQKYSSSSEPTTRNNSLSNKPKKRLSGGLSPSKSDYLIQHSKKERKRQLSWINNEIVYLRELKKLLQNKDVTSDISDDTTDTVEVTMKETKTERMQHQTSGETDHSRSSSLNINNLSKYLTNEQIKFLIKHDASHIHHHTCTCKKSQSKIMDVSSRHRDKDQSQTTDNKSSFQDTVLSEINGFSYNSHNYKISRNLKTSHISTKSTAKENQNKIVGKTEMMDAGIQCTIRKKKSDSSSNQRSEVSSTVCTDISKLNISDTNPSVCISVENVYNSASTDETSRTTPSDSLNQISKSAKSRKLGKENRNIHCAKERTNNKHPLAYFLTFEEKSPSDLSMNGDTANRKVLPNVVVKVPKLRKASKDKIDANKDVPDYTLQEYLMRNRPDFVKIAEWRRHYVTDPRERPKTLFTCRELKEITLKQYKKLPEVQNKLKDHETENQKRHNRYMASRFSKKLQRKTLQGQISLSTCIRVMSSSS